jgi:hypothetical protein
MNMPNKAPVAEPIEKEEAACKHYWVIQAATGPVSPGVCQSCGETRDFKNYVEASTWGEDKSASRKAAAVKAPASEEEEAEE